jgi:hypothetical protein
MLHAPAIQAQNANILLFFESEKGKINSVSGEFAARLFRSEVFVARGYKSLSLLIA